jgi:hypothetical protein
MQSVTHKAFMLSVVMLSVVMLSVVMLSVVMLSVVIQSVVILSVVAPKKDIFMFSTRVGSRLTHSY